MREIMKKNQTPASLSRRVFYRTAIPCSLVISGILLVSCSSEGHPQSNGQKLENQQQANDTSSLVVNQPIPGIVWSQVRQNLIELETSQANTTQTTTFMFASAYDPDPIDSCPSVGDPIPGTAQLSNPMQITHDSYPSSGAAVPIPQMDPNGIYGGDTAATYVMCVNAQGKVEPRRAEGIVHTVYGPATWDYTKHQVQLTGPASFDFTKGRK